MEIEDKINKLFCEDELSIYVKKVDKFDARVIISYRDITQLIYIGIHEVMNFSLNGMCFKTKEVVDIIIEKEGIPEGKEEEFGRRLAGRLMTLLSNDPILKARKDLERFGGWVQ